MNHTLGSIEKIAKMFDRDPKLIMYALKHDCSYEDAEFMNKPFEEADPPHHYISLLDCGHYIELDESWNVVIESSGIGKPTEALCKRCNIFVKIVKQVKEYDAEPEVCGVMDRAGSTLYGTCELPLGHKGRHREMRNGQLWAEWGS